MRVGPSGTPPFGLWGTRDSDDQECAWVANPQESALNRASSNHPNRKESFGFLLTPANGVEPIGETRPEEPSKRCRTAPPRSVFTDVELVSIEKRLEHWLRFGRVAAERILSPTTRVVSFRPKTVFALVRQIASDFGTVRISVDIVRATTSGDVREAVPFVRPGGELYLSLEGNVQVRAVLEEIDAIEAAGVDPCEVSPDHWRHVHERLAAGELPRRYSAERHTAWLKRRTMES